jgi:XTP/dITP diphosphohydrolase
MLRLVIATRNRGKFRELAGLCRLRGIRWYSLAEFPHAPPVREDGRTFEANARKKARAAARVTGMLALAEDSGLEVEALRWGPGVRSARFAGRHGDDRANNARLLRRLRGLPLTRRRARYRCVLALASPSRVLAVTRGRWAGWIAERPRGHRGFGYDPVFLVPGAGKTVAELPASVKRRLSHRAAAARAMRPVLRRLAASGRGR